MRNLFNFDGPVLQFIHKIVYSVYLNILWFLCCIPIVTVGASTTALFYVTLKMSKNEEGNITKAFFHSFRENLKQGTLIWLILLALGILLGIDGYVLYIFPLLARFDNTIGAMFKNALFIGVRFLFCTALMAAIYFGMLLVVVRIFTPAIIFGEGFCALFCSYLLSNVLRLCQEKTEEHADTVSGI